jgi:glycerophosphoryl diester phosphodiesterase|tara:strand:+ start:1285 stop:1905 length:621 start_codon:yes stop_codon:yes gene_type:complete
MKCIAHRGYSLMHIDNSIEAIREAVHREYDGVEIDIQLCGSGDIVLFHDVYVGNHFICDLNLDELRQMGVCSLEDIYEQIPEIKDTLLLLDIKGNNFQITQALEKFYEKRSTRNVIFCSFNRKLIYNLPEMFQKGSTFETTFNRWEYDSITRGLKAVVLHWTCLDHDFISYCKMKDIRVYTYTHKDDKELEYMYKYNVDAIITNGF